MNIYIAELRRFCHNRVVQELCNQFERQWPKQAEICAAASSRMYVALMIHAPSPPLRADRTRRDTVQRRHQHLQQNWKQSFRICKCQNSESPQARSLHSFLSVLAFSDRDVTGLGEWQIERECVLLLKNLESSCWVPLWINAIWLVASEIQHVSYSEEEKKGLKTHRRRCNKPNRRPTDRLTHNTEEKRNVTCVLNGQRGLNFTGEPTQCDQIKRLKKGNWSVH